MSDDRDQVPPGEPVPPVDDPFLAEDPEAYERERRRLQREAKRRERSGRKSLASRVSGALDGAADKGREAIEQTKEAGHPKRYPGYHNKPATNAAVPSSPPSTVKGHPVHSLAAESPSSTTRNAPNPGTSPLRPNPKPWTGR